MTEPKDSCRPVTVPSGESIRVRGAEPLDAAGVAALGELVDVVRRMMPEPDPGAAELWARVDAARRPLMLTARGAARDAGVAPSALSRLAQGRMPVGSALAAIERWLEASGPASTGVGTGSANSNETSSSVAPTEE